MQFDNTTPASPSLSVIINSFNYERFLPEAIDSVLALDTKLAEIVVVDDGSTDGSRDVIARYGSRIKPVLQSNMGQLKACLNAFTHTTGDYIYCLDSDDRVNPEFASRVPAALSRGPAKVQFRLSSIGPDGVRLPSTFPTFPPGYDTAQALRDMEVWGLYISPPTSGNVFRRDVLERVLAAHADYDRVIDGLALYLAPTMGELITLPDALASYRLHGTNVSQQHVLSAARLRRDVDLVAARWRHVSELTGRPNPFATKGPPGMVREWLIMIAVAENRRPKLADALAFVNRLWASSLPRKLRVVMTTWAFAMMILPPSISNTICKWRLSPLNRPKWLNNAWGRSSAHGPIDNGTR